MKTLLILVLGTIVIFFVWNILKRMFYTKFYQFQQKNPAEKMQSSPKPKVKWDAETVDFEEIQEPHHDKK